MPIAYAVPQNFNVIGIYRWMLSTLFASP